MENNESGQFQKKCSACDHIMIYETKRKLNQAINNNSMCEECRRKRLSNARKGKPLSEDTKNKIKLERINNSKKYKEIYSQVSIKLKGRKFSDEHRKNLSNSLKGDKNHCKRKDVREKIRNTAINNYLNSKPINTFTKGNKITSFSGTTLYYQGSYELDFLGKYYGRFNIENGKVFKYIDGEGNERMYISDFYLPDYNLIVEVKSTYTLLKCKSAINNKFKEKQALNDGYNFIFIVDKNYEEFYQLIYNYKN